MDLKEMSAESHLAAGAVLGAGSSLVYSGKKSTKTKVITAGLGALIGAALGYHFKTPLAADIAEVAAGRDPVRQPNESYANYVQRVQNARTAYFQKTLG